MATQSNNLMLLDSSGFPRVIDTDNDEIAISVPFFMNGGASVGGNLTVSGDIVSKGQINLTIQDAFIDLGIGNTSTTAQAGGFSFSLKANTGSVQTAGGETITAMVAGVNATSAPTLIVSGATQFAANDILVLTGTSDGANDGLFVVNSISTDPLSDGNDNIILQGVGGTTPNGSIAFVQTQLAARTGETAKAYKADITLLVVADGSNFPDAGGNPYTIGSFLSIYANGASNGVGEEKGAVAGDFTGNGKYQALGAAAANLQSAYNAGNSITTSAGKPLTVTMAQDGAGFSVLAGAAGAGEVVFGASGGNKIDSFNVYSEGNVEFSANTGLASLAGVGLTLEAKTGALTIAADASSTISVAGTNQNLDIDSSGQLSLNSSGNKINIGNDDIDQGIDIGTNGERTINIGNNFAQPNGSVIIAAPTLNFDGSAVTIDAKDGGSIGIGTSADAASDTSPINIGTSATARTITVGNAASTQLNLNADDVNVSGATTLDLVGATIQIGANTDAGKTINIGASSQANPITIDAGTGAFGIQSAANSTIEVNGSNGDGINLNLTAVNAAGPAFINLTADVVSFSASAEFTQGAGIAGTAGEALSEGRVVVLADDPNSTGNAVFLHATADAASDAQRAIHATTFSSMSDGDQMNFGGVAGTVSNLQFAGGNPAAANIGANVYLYAAGATAADKGKVTLTAPTGSGETVFKVGVVASSTAVNTNYFPVLIQPQFIAKRP